MPPKDKNKPRGKMTSYAYFVQTCRQEHKNKHPGDTVVFAEFSKKCSEKWRTMGPKEKKRFEEMADKDKVRYEREMSHYTPEGGVPGGGRKRKMTKDPNAPKRALSAFFHFCSEARPEARAANPGAGVGDIAKVLGKKWEGVKDRSKYEALAATDKQRYEKEMAIYKGKKPKAAPPVRVAPPPPVEDDDDDEEEDDDDDEEEEDDE